MQNATQLKGQAIDGIALFSERFKVLCAAPQMTFGRARGITTLQAELGCILRQRGGV